MIIKLAMLEKQANPMAMAFSGLAKGIGNVFRSIGGKGIAAVESKLAGAVPTSVAAPIVAKAAPIKQAGVKGAIGRLMNNNTIRNTAIGTGVGAVGGAITAEEGERTSGALKGGLLGGAIGGLGTAGVNINKTMNNQSLANKLGPLSFKDAARREIGKVQSAFGSAARATSLV